MKTTSGKHGVDGGTGSRAARGGAVVAVLAAAAVCVVAVPAPLMAQGSTSGGAGEASDRVRGPDPGARPATVQLALPFRRSFPLLDASLRIEVVGEAPGELRVVRGGGGRVRVHGQAGGGLASASLDERRGPGTALRLTSLDADRVLYLVEVPSRTLVRVRLPGWRSSQSLGTLEEVATYRWGS